MAECLGERHVSDCVRILVHGAGIRGLRELCGKSDASLLFGSDMRTDTDEDTRSTMS